ncbi:unnamed protein product [Oikopleura dioica]|uniref:Uncharacterized protein n=1 Tax=Oikopleura dioica TaxID=34765 RepID=E4XI65_OIKDI|nr:unnamed protein product [Oikopleura dioica]CBY32736.1 unnamed protein product [Oikopleura dioica]CBY35718.1 unnamed protein product [Oikopleura dioica]
MLEFLSDIRGTRCKGFICDKPVSCLGTLYNVIYQYSFIFSIFSFFVWILLHKFWATFLYSTTLDFFKKQNEADESFNRKVILKPNWSNCSLNAFHAVRIIYSLCLAFFGIMNLVQGFGTVSIGMANIFFISGVGFHLYVFLWQWHVGGSVKQKLKTFLTGESTVNTTGMLLHLFTLYFTCQELAVHKSDLHFSDTSGGHSSEYTRLLHLHLSDKDAILGSVMLRQLSVNAIPAILKALLEFNLFQINEARDPPSIAGFPLSTRGVLYGELVSCFLLSPILVGQVKAEYIIAMLVLFFLRQFYIVYCTYLLKKQTEDPEEETKTEPAESAQSIWDSFKRE